MMAQNPYTLFVCASIFELLKKLIEASYLILVAGFYNIYLTFLHTKSLKKRLYVSFPAFSSFLRKLTFQRPKS
jgi:hypothetical protein